MEEVFKFMIISIVFVAGLVGLSALVASYCSSPQTPAQREQELEDIKRQQRTFWTGQI